MEIERKFLCGILPFSLTDFPKKELEQAYISFSPVIRIRREDDSFFLTIKGKGHMSREEYTLSISEKDYETLLQKTEGTSIIKSRYLIPLPNDLTAELDIFQGALSPLSTVEVEFLTEDAAKTFVPPIWFGEDVTEDVRYKNNTLAKEGAPR